MDVKEPSNMSSHHEYAGDSNKDMAIIDGQDRSSDVRHIRRKVDWRIVPIMFLCYTIQFIDKISLNYSRVMGMNEDLGLKGNDFSNAATAFFIAYLVAEVPTGYLLNKIPTATYLGVNVICWGIATACTGAAQNYPSLVAARVTLGLFESAIAPCLTLISSQWYTKSEQAPRFSFWYCGLGAGQIIGGIISFGFQKVTNTSLESWRIMFIFLGALTVMTGVIVLLWLPNTPESAKFLTQEEKAAILQHVAQNQIGVQSREFRIRQVFELLVDVQFWLLAMMTMLSSISSGVVTTYSAILIRYIGFKPDTAALLNMPSGVVSIAATLIVGFGVRYTRNGHRWLWIIFSCIPGTLGGGLMAFLPSKPPHINKAGLLASIYMINAIVPVMAIVFQWAASNIVGQTKRTVSLSLIAASFSLGNIVGPQTFQARDAPDYIPAKITLLATQGGCALAALSLYLYYRWVNHRRDMASSSLSANNVGVSGNLTDKQNPNFRYVY